MRPEASLCTHNGGFADQQVRLDAAKLNSAANGVAAVRERAAAGLEDAAVGRRLRRRTVHRLAARHFANPAAVAAALEPRRPRQPVAPPAPIVCAPREARVLLDQLEVRVALVLQPGATHWRAHWRRTGPLS
jgi:hypothetical protein